MNAPINILIVEDETDLAQILAQLQDKKTGKILIDGFYDKVRPLDTIADAKQPWREMV